LTITFCDQVQIFYRLLVKMRTTFGGNSLFNGDFSLTWQSLNATEKGGERATQRRDREGERQSVAAKGHGVGNKLDLWRKYL